MTEAQWNELLAVVQGRPTERVPIGFIIDSPWLPGWFGCDTVEFITRQDLWFAAHRKAHETFPECVFLPGFWSEFGMCTDPSAFGTRTLFPRNEFPFAEKCITHLDQIAGLPDPNPETDGLLPFMIHRLKWAEPGLAGLGMQVRFSVSRGPLNVASFLMGTTEFLMALKTDPEPMQRLLRKITDFLKRWHAWQRENFPTIDGIMLLDDIVGFIGEEDYLEFAHPYLRELYAPPAAVKFFHNDAPCAASLHHYADLGINLYNPGVQNTLAELRQMCGHRLAILGTIPPRDVLMRGTPDQVRAAVGDLLRENPDHTRLMLSCSGGMPPGTSTANIRAFIEAARS